MSDPKAYLRICEQAARAGGQVLRDWAGKINAREKGPADLVTEADVASQETIRDLLLGAFPGHGFLGEENASIPSRDDGYRWIVDPLDGTTNYVHGIPFYCVSIALEQRGRLVAGTVYDPVADACFSAAAGCGATLNGAPLAVSAVQNIAGAVLALSFPAGIGPGAQELREFADFAVRAQSLRRLGSSALNLCYVAAGRFDAYWSRNVKIWDVAAGLLIVQEAGGIVTNRTGGPMQLEPPHFVAAATPALHHELVHVLRTFDATP